MSFISRLTYVKKQRENDDVYTFYFASKEKLDHKAGQHGIFLLPGLYRPHPFTLSSSPDEDYVTISTHTATGSRYKDKLVHMKPGDTILLIGPLLNFTFVKNVSEYVFLAQGIGITPFRSMLVHAHAAQLPLTTTLIHVDSGEHIFSQLTQRYATHAYFAVNSEEFREMVTRQDSNSVFYISGSPRFVRSTKKLLYESGVKKSHVKTDSFLGY